MGEMTPGSAREEAERLVVTALAAAQMAARRWSEGARTAGHAPDSARDAAPGSAGAGDSPGDAGTGGGAAGHRSGFATGEPICCVCPLCRAMTAMRDPDPVFVERLASGAGDFAAGLASLLRALGDVAGRPGAEAGSSGTGWSQAGSSGAGYAAPAPADSGDLDGRDGRDDLATEDDLVVDDLVVEGDQETEGGRAAGAGRPDVPESRADRGDAGGARLSRSDPAEIWRAATRAADPYAGDRSAPDPWAAATAAYLRAAGAAEEFRGAGAGSTAGRAEQPERPVTVRKPMAKKAVKKAVRRPEAVGEPPAGPESGTAGVDRSGEEPGTVGEQV